ncbi:MAG: hypothetical protein JNM52_04930 [Betaproteobacteria bacterium]|nr:hypothetical protein [Betaproteobacteria bacterium]
MKSISLVGALLIAAVPLTTLAADADCFPACDAAVAVEHAMTSITVTNKKQADL